LALVVFVVALPHPCGIALQLGHVKAANRHLNSVPAEQDMGVADWAGWHWQKVEQLLISCQYSSSLGQLQTMLEQVGQLETSLFGAEMSFPRLPKSRKLYRTTTEKKTCKV